MLDQITEMFVCMIMVMRSLSYDNLSEMSGHNILSDYAMIHILSLRFLPITQHQSEVDLLTCLIVSFCLRSFQRLQTGCIKNTAAKCQKNVHVCLLLLSPPFLHSSHSTLLLISLLLHLTGDWMPPGVQNKFHTWSGPGNQLENPSSIFNLRLHFISSPFLSLFIPVLFTPQRHVILSFLPPHLDLGPLLLLYSTN